MKSSLKLLLIGILLTSACSSFAGRQRAEAPNPRLYIDKGVALFTPFSFGKGCPLEGKIVTARHILVDPIRPGMFSNATWSDQYGRSGGAVLSAVSYEVDGAILHPDGIPKPHPVKTGRPTKGLYFFDYNYESPETAFDPVLRKTKLLKLVGGYIIMDVAPSSGASGGCIYNDQDEAVGIVVWSIILNNEEKIGLGVQFLEGW